MHGTDHIKETDGCPPLSEQQAREQLQYEMRNQMGRLTLRAEETSRPDRDGTVVAYINGRQADHYLYKEPADEETSSSQEVSK